MSAQRSIFEEVGAEAPPSVATAPKGPKGTGSGARRAIAVWLMALFALVVVMIAVGGLTRLTDSGLSITEWRPVTGALPPLSDAHWAEEFEKYKAIPQYELVNKGMSLSEFKVIYYWEWGHRQLGRVIGLVWAIGFLWFWLRKQIPTGWTGRLLTLGALGGLQGAIGWWMVASGLTGEMIAVASYRLAVHLGLAFAILGLIAWSIFELRLAPAEILQRRRVREARLFSLAGILVGLAFFQILLGALVAGIDAGRGYIDWPLMGGQVLPSESFDYVPLWTNFFENPALVQFNHRVVGYILFLAGLFVWWRSRGSAVAGVRTGFDWMMALMLGQVVLGIGTVLYAAPVGLAIIHQFGAVLLFVSILRARFLAGYPPEQRIARA
ncbi:heme A synthase [Oceanomicrobium pacificus]|uniref:Heme A synthase n=1 Tax=Oceanomicrobium pacificus TaxID=2692916 RepID=A0A6B0TYC3_9RHOB|nr:heme A synthase [Oceanomicrobium pacificus]MXU66282.1 heme A synthase [Oceanomicrobium pacificus]